MVVGSSVVINPVSELADRKQFTLLFEIYYTLICSLGKSLEIGHVGTGTVHPNSLEKPRNHVM